MKELFNMGEKHDIVIPLGVKSFENENFESNIKGIYPCGEGCGYAGGITTAAMDGLKTAENLVKKEV